MSTGFSSMDFSGSARRSLKDYFCGRCPAFSSASCFNSPTDWFDIYFYSNLTIISCTQSYHITWCRSCVHLFQYCWTRQWWVTGLQGWLSPIPSGTDNSNVCCHVHLLSTVSYDLRHRISKHDTFNGNFTWIQFSNFPGIQYWICQLIIPHYHPTKRLNWYPWVNTGWNMERCDASNYNPYIEVIYINHENY